MMASFQSRISNLKLSILPFIVLAFLLRLAPLGRYVTPDEPAWVYRAIRFSDALSARDWAAIPSTGHPGVTTMWLGALGVTVQRLLSFAESRVHLDWIRSLAWLAPENGEAFRHLAFFLPWARVAVVLTTTLGLAALYPLLMRLFDRRVALLTVGLLACDPFLIGHSGLLHTDALLATFFALSILCLLAAARDGPRWWGWALAGGAAAGLALLTKSLAAFLLPFALLVLGSAWLLRRMRFLRAIALFLLWGLAAAALYWVLYPAMWTAPAQTLRDLVTAPSYHAQAALMPTFFAGRVALEHGPEFYAVALPFRLSPIVLLGLVFSVRAFVKERSLRQDLAWLWLFALGYMLLLALNAKKYDRYLLPVFPPLALVAALGWGRLSKRFILLLVQFVLALIFVLYPLAAFNPLAGGPWVASRLLPVDWGEGMGAAARWLNRLPDADQLTVAAISVPSFAPLFDGHTVPLDQATLADYVVRSPTSTSSQPIAHVARLGFLDHAAIYTNTAPFEQAAYLADRVEPDDLIILDADTPLLRRYTGPGAIVSLADLPDQAGVAARLAELSVDYSRFWLVADPAASPITAAHLRQELELFATPVSTATVASATITQYANPRSPIPNPQSPSSSFSDQIALIDALLPAVPVNASFTIYLRWQVPAPTLTDLHTSLYLRDSSNHLWAEVGQPLLNDVTFPTSAWAPGDWADNALTMKLPQRIPPGDYALQLTVTDAEGAQLGAWDAGGEFQGVRVSLGDVRIALPAEPVGPAECEEGHTLAATPFLACLPDLPPQAVPSGDALPLALTWSAVTPPLSDYSVRWRLLDPDGGIALEQIADLSPYATSRWRAGDSFDVRYDLRCDPALPTTVYTLALNVLAPDGAPLWETDAELTAIEILPRDRLFDLPPDITHPLDLTLGHIVHLRGFDLIRAQAVPGDALPLTLYWQADGPTDIDYTIFVHLVGSDGRPHGQLDFIPSGGAAPTTSWASGQVIIDDTALPVADDAPTGVYQVAVGMYDRDSGGRLPVTDPAGNSLPDDQVILPIVVTVAGGQQ